MIVQGCIPGLGSRTRVGWTRAGGEDVIGQNTTVITDADLTRLEAMIRSLRTVGEPFRGQVNELRQHVRGARLVPAKEVEPDVVTMNSRVRVRDVESGRMETFTLAYHGEAEMFGDRLTVLSPLGIRVLGARVGDILEWDVPHGVRRLAVERILYQPETEKSFDR
jgi:regulator of nucleoside diphosphate kinase